MANKVKTVGTSTSQDVRDLGNRNLVLNWVTLPSKEGVEMQTEIIKEQDVIKFPATKFNGSIYALVNADVIQAAYLLQKPIMFEIYDTFSFIPAEKLYMTKDSFDSKYIDSNGYILIGDLLKISCTVENEIDRTAFPKITTVLGNADYWLKQVELERYSMFGFIFSGAMIKDMGKALKLSPIRKLS